MGGTSSPTLLCGETGSSESLGCWEWRSAGGLWPVAQELTVGGVWGGRPKEGSVLALNKNNNEDGDSNSHDKTGLAVSSRKPPNNNG